MRPTRTSNASVRLGGLGVTLALALGVTAPTSADILDTGASITAFLDYNGTGVNLFPVPTQPFDPAGTTFVALNPDTDLNSISLNLPSTFAPPSTPPATILANSVEVTVDIANPLGAVIAPFTVSVTGLVFDGGTEVLVSLSGFGGTGNISGWSDEASWSFVDSQTVLFTYIGGTPATGGTLGETARFVTEPLAVPEPMSFALLMAGLLALRVRRSAAT